MQYLHKQWDKLTVYTTDATANLYSPVETAKANGYEAYAYRKHVLTKLPAATTLEGVEALLPFNLQPTECKVA